MLDSVPGPLQAILWPLIGAAIVLALGRFLPSWLRRLLASMAALASLTNLWALRTGGIERIEIPWEPLNFFRMGPSLLPDGLALLVGLTLAGITAACVLGIRGPDSRRSAESRRSAWHGLILAALSGCLVLIMGTNLLTLVLGSAFIDLALIAIIVSSPGITDRAVWRLAVPGAASTLVLIFGALLMDVQVGHASLSAQDIPEQMLSLLGLAGLLRMLVFPLHPRGIKTPEAAATLLLPVGAGIYLLARVQTIAPVLAEPPWILAIGSMALLAGGFLALTGGMGSKVRRRTDSQGSGFGWPGLAIHQTGYALGFVVLLGASVPWPLLSLTLALAMLAIWWDMSLEPENALPPGWMEWIGQRLEPWWQRLRTSVSERAPRVERLGRSWFVTRGMVLLPIAALASLAGAPFTAGAVGRWSFYASLLHKREATLLLVTLIADALLAAGLWLAAGVVLKQNLDRRPKVMATIAMLVLAVLLIMLGVAPSSLVEGIGLDRLQAPSVSVGGLGLIFVLPWLLGGWLARVSSHVETLSTPARRLVGLDWLYRAGSWAGRRLAEAIGWLGQVGEGEGWWGWALVILALGTMFLTLR